MAKRKVMEFDSTAPVEYTRKKWFMKVKSITKLFIKKPEFVFLGEKPTPSSIILSNHEGTGAPLSLELYGGLPVRFWGAHEMATNMKLAYGYQTKTYYHKKKHWNLTLARLFCLIATPLTRMFYNGLEIIPSYGDIRFKNTLSQSVAALKKGHTVVIFPEDSDTGYLKELIGFHQGAFLLLEYCKRHNLDVPVHVAYYKKDTKQFVFDKPVSVRELLDLGLTREKLADRLCRRCNELGKLELETV